MSIKELNIKNAFEYICHNLSSALIFELLENENVELAQENQLEGSILIARKLKANSINDEVFGYYLIQILNEECSLEKIKQYLELLEKYALNFTRANYMAIEPIIIANDFSDSALDFLEQYNNIERRKEIKLFKLIT